MSLPLFHVLGAAPKVGGPYSHAVEADGWVFLAGQTPNDPADPTAPFPAGIEAQTRRVLDNLVIVLGELGLGLGHVVAARIFLVDLPGEIAAMNRVYTTYFPEDRRPARTTIGVTALAVGALVEIDMIRHGGHVLAVPQSKIPAEYLSPYAVCVTRGWQFARAEYYPIYLKDPLPRFRVPLRESDPDVVLDLQLLLSEAYATGNYDDIQYGRDAEPPLKGDDAVWADELLRSQGKR